jgi:RNA 2',3'-cyclic 3'-phosphodiesterase
VGFKFYYGQIIIFIKLKARSFISVDVSIKDNISELQNKIMLEEDWKMRQVKPVESQNLHFCIIFLGNITPMAIELLKSRLSCIIFQPFRVVYKGLGVFPNTKDARIVWMGTDIEGGKKLTNLSQKVTASIQDVAFIPDKPFIPHVTLFRIKNGILRTENMLTKYKELSFGSDFIERIHLKRSQLTPSGPIYSDIYTVYGE